MNDKRKYLFWLIPAALVLLAALFFLCPRRADIILHLPESADDIHGVYFQRTAPIPETREFFSQDYTLTADRQPELMQAVCGWLYAARLRRPMPGGTLEDPGVVYILYAQPADDTAAAALQIAEDGRAVVNGVRYHLNRQDMDALNAIYEQLNTVYD